MRATMIPIVVGIIVTVSKDLEIGLEELEIIERIEVIQTIAVLRLLEYWEESWRPK